MKLKKVKFNNHKVLRDLEVIFEDKNNNILDTTVLIGANGAGKTSLLKGIYDAFCWRTAIYINTDTKLYLEANPTEINNMAFIQCGSDEGQWNAIKDKLYEFNINNDNNTESKVIYMPTEINFNLLNRVDRSFKYDYNFINEINQNLVADLPSVIANAINAEVFKNEDLPPKQSIKKICDDINSIFKYMDLEIKFIGLSKDEDSKPIFKDITGNEFDIENLSSGEKQLFLRALSLKFLNPKNSIVLIDEPEISLHPQWQRKIIKVYESIGENNQLIIATHSPHVVGDIKREQLRVLKRDENGVSIVDNDRLDETYGHTVESILKSIMGLNSVRNDYIEKKFENLRELLQDELYDTDEFKDIYEELKDYLGNLDIDLNLINLDIRRRERKKGK